MVSSALFSVVLCASQINVASVGFSQVGLNDGQATFYAEHFAAKLAEDDALRVTTPKDMSAILGVERQKQLLGCSDAGSSCMAELAGALGADAVVTGQVARVGKSYQLNVKILGSSGSRTLFVHSSKLLPTEEALIEELNAVAALATSRLREQLHATAQAPVGNLDAKTSSSAPHWLRLIVPVVVGVAAGVVGGIELASSSAAYGRLNDKVSYASYTPDQALADRNNGKTSFYIGVTLAAVGVVAIAAGIVWFLMDGPSSQVSLNDAMTGRFAFAGVWP